MKQSFLLSVLISLSVVLLQAQNRYFGEVFSSVSVDTDVVYGNNLSVLTGSPVAENLLMDVYTPDGDTASSRPVVVVIHHSEFLPVQLNQHCVGTRADYHIVELCTRLAKYGYVVAAIDHRLGWNPIGWSQEERTATYLNAMYRATQDARNAVRYFRWSVDNGNPYSIDPNKISIVGEGTGAEIASWVGSLDRFEELELAKFIDPSTGGDSYVDSSLSGNVYGTNTRPLNIANYPNYSSDVNFVGSLGGSVGDSTWIEAGEPSVVSMHSPTNPYIPYGFGAAIIAVTGDFLLNVSGANDVQRISNALGNNDVYISAMLNDPITQIANASNEGNSGLYPFFRPGPETNPWQWWDPCPYNTQATQFNPDMSEAKGQAYIDTIMAYMAPRMAFANGFLNSGVGVDELDAGDFQLYPNPATHIVNFAYLGTNKLTQLSLIDASGRVVLQRNSNRGQLDVSTLPKGLYLLRFELKNGFYAKHVVVH